MARGTAKPEAVEHGLCAPYLHSLPAQAARACQDQADLEVKSVVAISEPKPVLLPTFAAAHFTHHLCTGSLVPLLPLMKIAFDLDYFQSGLLVSAFSLAYGFGGPPIAWLADRVSRRRLIVLGLVGVAVSSFAVGLATDYSQLVVLLVLMGLLGASYHAPASSLLSSIVDKTGRGRSLGVHIIGGSAAFLVTPVLAGTIASLLSWNWAFILLSFPALVSAALLARVAKEPEAAAVKAAAIAKDGKSIPMLAIARLVGGVILVAVFIGVVGSAFSAFLPLFLADVHGVPPALAGMLGGLAIGTGVLGAPIGGALSDRFGRKPVILLSMVFTGPLIYLVAITEFGILLFVLMGVYGIATSMRMAPIESFIADVVPFDRRATVLGVYYFLGQETAGVATPIVGRFIDTTGATNAFVCLAIAATALSAAALLVRRRL